MTTSGITAPATAVRARGLPSPWLAGAVVFLVVALLVGLATGPVRIEPWTILVSALSHVPYLGIRSHLSTVDSAVVWQIRAPRVVLAALVGSVERSLVFARTRAFAEQLADDLDAEGVRTESLHGDLNQARRTRNLARFSEGKVAALVATDVAARGIHVDDIDLVIHADAAEDYKTYLHRSGRTGRAGASGTVVTLINPRRRRRMTELLGRAGVEAAFVTVHEGDDPVAALRA